MGVPALKTLCGPCPQLVPTLTADQRLQEPSEASAATEGSRV